eukprot:TRINITY_DN10915_c0_g1_i2.p1 TRINITY_DN10915_c0_g1~~TRINITY_DN10915_c0_g1_i2.p1  ORF type:complete len:270 (-),score=68.64 TRINITY_DN10915_c0_g1_i2:11-739(-)
MGFLDDPCQDVQEQAVSLVRNLVFQYSVSVVSEDQVHTLIDRLAGLMRTSQHRPETLKHVLYIISNLAAGPTERVRQSLVMRDSILHHVCALLEHSDPQLRLAAVWCAHNLGWTEDKDDDNETTMDTEVDVEGEGDDDGDGEVEVMEETSSSSSSSAAAAGRISRLREAGVVNKIAALAHDPDLDVRKCSKACLSLFEKSSSSSTPLSSSSSSSAVATGSNSIFIQNYINRITGGDEEMHSD